MLREYLISEAMAALGRADDAVAGGGGDRRDGAARDGPLPGAVLARVAASHIRVGTFQFFSARGDQAKLTALLHYTIARHYPRAGWQPRLRLWRCSMRWRRGRRG